jgi:nucleoside-diphosphate-sugar epimerase
MILLTGASGFVGKAVLKTAQKRCIEIRPVYRTITSASGQSSAVLISSLDSKSDWFQALQDVDVIIHTAGRAHIISEDARDPFSAYQLVNVQGTLNLARQAAAAGVQRFVFISSIKVNGEATPESQSFTADDNPAPEDAYGLSKAEAEAGLMQLNKETGMEMVFIRPPLIYGPDVKGNFANLVRWVQRGVPLPLGAVHNKRSFVALENLVSLVLLCADRSRSPQAANQVFVVADGEDVSTSTLLRKVARAAGRPSRLLPVPARWVLAGASLLGKRAVADRLLGNLQVDATKARSLLGWRPVVTMDEQLSKMFEHKD